MSKKNSESTKKVTFKLGLYFTFWATILIVTITTFFAMFTWLNMKNITNGYNSNIDKLYYNLRNVLESVAIMEGNKTKLPFTEKVVSLYLETDVFPYISIINTKDNKTVLGSSSNEIVTKMRESKVDIEKRFLNFGNYTLIIGIPKQNADKFTESNLASFIWNILFLFTTIAIIFGAMISGRISKPLETLSSAAKNIADGNFNIKIKKTRFTEINELIDTYNEMAHQLDELYTSLELKVQERTMALEAANHKLQETQAMMVHSEKMRSLGELVAGIAHEINNPVNFIHGNIMILQNYADDLFKLIDLFDKNSDVLSQEEKAKIESLKKEIDLEFLRDDIKDLIKSCIEGTQRTKNIVLDLKNFSRMEEMVLTQFDIPKEIDTTLNILNNKYKNRIEVIKNYGADVPKIEAYGGQLNQVFMNILDNAQDAMGEQGQLIINTSCIEENKVKIEFIDNGAGIPEENLKKVFDPFFTTKTVGKGTGLGMSISYRVINDHKGTIQVESEVGKGTKFTIILPINHNTDSQDEITENGVQTNGTEI